MSFVDLDLSSRQWFSYFCQIFIYKFTKQFLGGGGSGPQVPSSYANGSTIKFNVKLHKLFHFQGSETSALTISYACLFLAMDHQIQTKVSTEIKQVFPSRNTEVTPETLKQLAYMEMVLKETLRLCPAVPFAARSNETPIKLDGVYIPQGQIFCFNFYSLHRRKDLWGDDPERFDPERFSTEASQNRHPYAYLPFSGGFRNCIGGRYALNSLKIMLLRILQNFHIDTSLKRENMRFRWAITMKLVGPHAVRMTRRDLYQQNPPSSPSSSAARDLCQ